MSAGLKWGPKGPLKYGVKKNINKKRKKKVEKRGKNRRKKNINLINIIKANEILIQLYIQKYLLPCYVDYLLPL